MTYINFTRHPPCSSYVGVPMGPSHDELYCVPVCVFIRTLISLISELWPLSLSICQPTSVAILETKCELEKVWKYHNHLHQIDPIKRSSCTNDFLGQLDLFVISAYAHIHTHTQHTHTPTHTHTPSTLSLQTTGLSTHTQSTQRTLTGILRCARRLAQERWKEVCSDRPPVPSPHPPPLLCSWTLSGECVSAMSIFTHNSLDWVVIPDIQELSGTLLTMVIVWVGWIVPDTLEYPGRYSRHLGRHGRQLPYM